MAGAKLHHYVPRFLLGRFSPDPLEENPAVCQLDKATGRTSWTGVKNVAAVTHYNRLQEGVLPSDIVETTLAAVEARASELLDRLLAEGPVAFDPGDHLDLALFVYFQHARTPRVRTWTVFAQEHAAQMAWMKYLIENPAEVVQHLVEQGETPESAEAKRLEWVDDLENGNLFARVGPDREVAGMFLVAQEAVPKIAFEMTWTVVRSDIPLILGDHPVAMYDPQVPSDQHGVGWFSSQAVEVTLPVDPRVALLLTPGKPGWREARANAAQAADLNLRSYASSEWWVFGGSEAAVQGVRANARANRHLVARYAPRPPAMHLLEETETPNLLRATKTYRPTEKPSRRGRSRAEG